MADVECDRCGAAFDPDREPKRPGMDTDRCPSCGHRHTSDAADRTETAVALGEGAAIRITIEVIEP